MDKIKYNLTVDFVNPNNNIAPAYPLIQDSDVEFDITLKEDGDLIDLGMYQWCFAYVVNYDKLDSHATVHNVPTLTVSKIGASKIRVTGKNLTAFENKCALVVFRYDDQSPSDMQIANPLYYTVRSNLVLTL